MPFERAYILPNIENPVGPVQHGYVYEHDAAGNLCAIVITGMIEYTDWQRVETLRIEGEELANLPEAVSDPDTADSPRFQAIMKLVGAFVAKRGAEIDADMQARKPQTTQTPRPASEVAALPELTPALLEQLAPSSDPPAP